MTFKINERVLRGIIGLSAFACVIMITTARPLPLLLWLICAAVIGICFLTYPHSLLQNSEWVRTPWFWIAGGFLSFTAGYVFFYSTWSYSELFGMLAAHVGMGARMLALGGAGVLILVSTPFLAFLSASYCRMAREEYAGMKLRTGKSGIGFWKTFWILFAVFAFGMTAILRANFYYIDDLGRAAYGYKEWQFFSRFLSAALSTYLHGDSYLTDVSPVPQLAAAAILALSGALLLSVVYDRKNFTVWEIIAVIPLGLNPYFLECLSYKYDAPYMALSIFGAVFPLLFRKRSTAAYALISLSGTLIMCTTYQAASGIYPMLVIVIALRTWCSGEKLKDAIHFCLRSAVSFGAGLLLFQQLILRPEKTYAGAIASADSMAETLVSNYRKYYGLAAGDFKFFWLILIAVLAAGFMFRIVAESRKSRICTALLGTVSLCLLLLLCFGVYPALKDASYDPRAMYGFGVMTAIFAVCAAEGDRFPVYKLAAAVLSWAFITFAFTYGNALYVQREYTDFRIQMVIEDLNDLGIQEREEPVRIEVVGSIGQSPILRNMPQDYQILNRLVPNNFNGDWMWGVYGLHNYYDLKNTVWIEESLTDPGELELVQDTMYHTIWGNEECLQIHLK